MGLGLGLGLELGLGLGLGLGFRLGLELGRARRLESKLEERPLRRRTLGLDRTGAVRDALVDLRSRWWVVSGQCSGVAVLAGGAASCPRLRHERLAGGTSTTIASAHLRHEVLRLLVAAEALHEVRERKVRLGELGSKLRRLPEQRLRRHEVATLVGRTAQLVLAVGIVPALVVRR